MTDERVAVVLAGGVGSRLKPFTAVIPKPLVPIGDLSIVEVVLQQLASHGFDRVYMSIGHLGHLIEAVVGDGARYGLSYAVRGFQRGQLLLIIISISI